MKKNYLSFLMVLFFVLPVIGQNSPNVKPKFSPLFKKYLHQIQLSDETNLVPSGFLYKHGDDGQPYISALIEVSDSSLAQENLDNIGAIVGTKAGDIWTVRLPYKKAVDFSQISGISYIQMDEPVVPLMDIARKTTRVDSVHRGINLPMKYSGKGVIVGIVDFGFDYNHPSFYDTLHKNYRVKQVWELNTKGTPPPGYSYGHEIKNQELIKAQGTDNPVQTHGTCVAGMAAGSGYGSNATNSRFRGMAYDADMVFVGVRRDTIARQWLEGSFTDFLDAINYIYRYAKSVGKPCVVNISWGSQSGPHDGSTLFNRACNNITGPGRILVMSAGNEGEEKIHLSKKFTATDTLINTFLTFTSEKYKRTWIDIWGEPGKTFCGKVTLYSKNKAGNTSNFICIDDKVHDQLLISANGKDTCFVQFISSHAESNGKSRITIDIYNKAPDSVGVSIKGHDGIIHTWDEYYYYGYTYGYQSAFDSLKQTWAKNGNVITTVSDMGAADSVLLIGAYASKVNYTDINKNPRSYSGYVGAGRLVPFSSRGPMLDGRIKPDITAPGLTIGTAVSSFDKAYTATGARSTSTILAYTDPELNKTFYYAEFTGTSASGPAAAGIVALMLQARPTLGPKEVRDILSKTAIKDQFTGIIPAEGNNNWGHGKINAYGAMKFISTLPGEVYNTGEKFHCELYPNPNNGLFTITNTSNNERDLKVEVYSMIGSLVKSINWPTVKGINISTFDLSASSPGVYLVRILSAEGRATVKVIMQ